jgi:hypothetical protein
MSRHSAFGNRLRKKVLEWGINGVRFNAVSLLLDIRYVATLIIS